MKSHRILILDLVAEGSAPSLFGRMMNANQASVMPQVVATWCEQLGHQVRYECYTGVEDLNDIILHHNADVVFISAYTLSALTAYAISALARAKGAITVLGGPHARCYPEDAGRYFDYVLGFTDKTVIDDLLHDLSPHRPMGRIMSAARQPLELPSLEERWKFVDATLRKAPWFKMVPMIGSMGCPYTCSFCIDATVDYQPLPFAQIESDLRFAATKIRNPMVGWHDPNFGIRFDDYMAVIERAVPNGRMRHVAETSLALLTPSHVQRMEKAGFVGILPGIESWYDYGNKSKSKSVSGMDKVEQVADHINLILRHIPFVQTNFVLGLDSDMGPEPFALSKRFIDLVPGAYPAFSLFTAYGRAASLNLGLQRSGRVLPVPFPFLDSNKAMNVRPLNYTWPEFYQLSLSLLQHAWSGKAVWRRLLANRGTTARGLNFVRAVTTRRVSYHADVLNLLRTDRKFRGYFEADHRTLPEFYESQIPQRLGPLHSWLPTDAATHDAHAYMNSEKVPERAPALVTA
ncbi:MAG: radical SAM protein [Rhodospirillaceae bacterium]|nr:MAG: radical SAM protein [Rhodospirillaceae bacterium]